MASDASHRATGRAWMLELCWHGDLVDTLFVVCTVTWEVCVCVELLGTMSSHVSESLVEQGFTGAVLCRVLL